MNDVVLVKIVDPFQHLCEEPECLWFGKGSFCILVVEKVSILCVVHDHIDLLSLEQGVPQLDYVWVIHCAVNGYFSFKQLELSVGRDIFESDLHGPKHTTLTA